MARIKFEQWYRKYGIRERGHLTRPRLFPTGAFQFPQEAVWHFREGNVQNGPSRNESLLQDVGGRIFIEHVTDLAEKVGSPRRTSVNVQTLENDYRRRSRGMRPLRRPEALTINPRNLLVVNYAMLHPLYRYTVSYRAEYYRWWNLAVTFWEKVQDVHERFDWNQFIDLQVPESIPTFQEFLRLGRDPTSAKSLESFRAPGALDLADIWQWLGDDRDSSAMSALKDPSRIQLVLRMRGHFTVVRLGLLDQWRRSTEPTPSMESYLSDLGVDQYDVEELELVISQESNQENSITPTQLQRMFLLLLRTLSKVQGGEIPLGDETPESEGDTPPPAETVKTNQQSKRPTPSDVEEVENEEAEEESGDEEELSDSLPKLPSIGDELEFPELGNLPEHPEIPEWLETVPIQAREPSVARESDPTDSNSLDYGARIRAHADEQLNLGLITKATHERLLRESGHYETLPDPYTGEGLLKESLEITQEDLVLESGEQFPDRETVTDKSMLSSTPRAMEQQYLEKVLKKDVLNSVLAATLNQNVVVRKYNVEEVHDSMNHFEVHTVTLKPVNGKQSTIRFRLPVVDSDGRFIANGQTNKLRLQRAD